MRQPGPAFLILALVAALAAGSGAAARDGRGPRPGQDPPPADTASPSEPPAPRGRGYLPATLFGAFPGEGPPTAAASRTAAATATARPTDTPGPTPDARTPATPTLAPTPGVEPPLLWLGAGRVLEPALAGPSDDSTCRHLVVWREEDPAGEGAVRARFLADEGPGAAFLVSGGAGAAGPPALAFNPALGRWLVAWAAPDTQRVSALRGRLVGCGGPEGEVIVVGDYWLIEDQPAVAAESEGFAVAWRRSFSGRPDYQLVGARVNGPAVPEPQRLGDPGPIVEPALACDGGGGCLVAWTRATDAYRRQVQARAWSPGAGLVAAEAQEIAAGEVPEFRPVLAWNGAAGAFAIAWSAEERYRSVYARSARLPAAGPGGQGPGPFLLGPPLLVSMGFGGSFTPALTALGNGFAVGYALDPRQAEWPDLAAARLAVAPGEGTLALAGLGRLSDGRLRSDQPAVAAAGETRLLVVWRDRLAAEEGQIVGGYTALSEGGAGGP